MHPGGSGDNGPGHTSGQGGGGAQGQPQPQPFYTHEIAQVAYLISEGPIEGLTTGDLKSVYLNDIPVQNSDDTFNFVGVAFAGVKGTNTQAVIPGFTDVETETSVNAEIKDVTPQIISISDPDVDAVRLKILFNSLIKFKLDGSTTDVFVQFQVTVSTDGGAYGSPIDLPRLGYVFGQTASSIEASWRIELPKPGTSWDIKIERLTANSTDTHVQDKSYLESYTALKDLRLRYPNSSVFCVAFDAKAFGSIPRVSFDVKLRTIQIPTNYDPIARTYATTGDGTSNGTWDGSFKTAWSDNPAWVLWDAATNDRYGAGQYLTSGNLDKWGLYAFAQYCDEMVDNGHVGEEVNTEPRFTCNLWLGGRDDAIKVLANIASIFLAQTYWLGGSVGFVQDQDESPVALFSPSNVVDGRFNYQGTAHAARHTAVIVNWNDPTQNYNSVSHYEADEAAVQRFGLNLAPATVAMGCTSEGQAVRFARWMLATEKLQPETVTFQTGMEGLAVAPGAIILVQDPARMTARLGGRCLSATLTSLTLDAPVVIGDDTYTLYVVLPDGSVANRELTNGPGETSTLTWTTALPTLPLEMAQWAVWAGSAAPSKWRVVGTRPVDQLTVEITGLYHDPDKYEIIENGFVVTDTAGTSLSLPPVTSAVGSEDLWVQGPGLVKVLKASWVAPTAQKPIGYRAIASLEYGPWREMQVIGTAAYLVGVQTGDWRILIAAYYGQTAGTRHYSPDVEADYTLVGKATPPADVTGLSAYYQGTQFQIVWNPNTDLDLAGYELRYGPTSTATWSTATMLVQQKGNTHQWSVKNLTDTTLFVKAIDTSGNYSTNADTVALTTSLPEPTAVTLAVTTTAP